MPQIRLSAPQRSSAKFITSCAVAEAMISSSTVDRKRMIAIAPIGEFSTEFLAEVGSIIAASLDAQMILTARIPLSSEAYNARRDQYHSTQILQTLANVKRQNWERMLGVVDVDLYIPELHFVFGEADMKRGVAIFSLARLRTPGSTEASKALFIKRAATEGIHELGHTYGLGHCDNAHCVMWFSNTLAETDRKDLAFCAKHASQLATARSSRQDS
jgi:archaemetzincin